MAEDNLPTGEPRFQQLRRLIVPNWLWQLTWMRHIPRYLRSIPWQESSKSRWQVLLDMLYIHFCLNSVPEHYIPCRLWDVPRSQFTRYYGSPYTPIARARFAKRIYPFEHEVLYNDKLINAQLTKGLDVRQPIIYGTLEPGAQFAERLSAIFDSAGVNRVVLKPVFGRSGIGINVAEKTPAGIVIHAGDKEIPLAQFAPRWPLFVQEIIRQDARMGVIWNSSVNTVRVITLLTASDDVLIVGTFIRFGIGKSFVDNWSAGGVSTAVDYKTGLLYPTAFDCMGRRYTHHPSSNVAFEGFQVPEWDAIIGAAEKLQRALPFSRMPGFDLCLDEQGKPVLIETNGLPDLVPSEQLTAPLLDRPEILKAFAEYDLLVNDAQRRKLAGV